MRFLQIWRCKPKCGIRLCICLDAKKHQHNTPVEKVGSTAHFCYILDQFSNLAVNTMQTT